MNIINIMYIAMLLSNKNKIVEDLYLIGLYNYFMQYETKFNKLKNK